MTFLEKSPLSWLIKGALAILISGCGINDLEFGNLDIPDYEPTLAVPLGVSRYTMRELVGDLQDNALTIEEGEDLFMTIVYMDTSYNDEREAFLYFPPINKSDIVFPFVSSAPGGQTEVIEFEKVITFSFDAFFGEKVDSIFFNSGNLALEINSRFRSDVMLEFGFPSMFETANNSPVSISDTLSFGTTVPVTSITRMPLGGKKFLFRRREEANDFDVIIKGKVVVKPGQSVDFSDFFRFSIDFSEATYSHVHGYFDQKEGLLQDRTIELKFFETFGDYGLDFKDPKIILKVDNSFGFPSGLLMNNLSASNNDSTSIALTGSITESLQFVNYPKLDSIGKTSHSEFVINAQNSNIRELFGITPVKFNLPLTVISNPDVFEKDYLNFMTDSSRFRTITVVELPFEVRMQEFTTNLKFGTDEIDLKNLQEAVLRFYTENEMPFEGRLAVNFADKNDTILFTVPEELVLTAPQVDASGRTLESKKLLSEIDLGIEGTEALKNADHLNVAIIINTFNAAEEEYVRLYADYALDINISVLGRLKIKIQ
ncbi:MAG: hypothetical protein RIF36_06925 [Imperialibacter sp.]|uniref:hypothetical protein n=1 Tax=Imperialibacter sp. TaxID=2038411 RepID=UPI0032EF26A2